MQILVVQTAFLGDLILTTPLLRELHRVQPGSRLCVLTTSQGAEVYGGLPYVDRTLVYDKRRNRMARWRGWSLARRVRAASFDVAIAAHRSHRTGAIVFLSGAPVRLGFERAPGSWAYRSAIVWNPRVHAVRRYLALSEPFGGAAEQADPRPDISLTAEHRNRVDRWLESELPDQREGLLCLAPGSIWPTKRWLPEGFSAVARAGLERGLQPVLIGSAAERDLCVRVARGVPGRIPVLAGATSIGELAALLERSRALICNDSGPSHVASAVHTPVVSIYGPTVPAFGYTAIGEATRVVEQMDLSCRPCHRHGPIRCPLGHFRCMREIRAERVVDRLEELLARDEERTSPSPDRPPVLGG